MLEGGDGPPMVLLHGPGEFAAKWMRVIPELVKTHRVVAPDLPGHGASGVDGGHLDGDRMAAWLGELIERTCPSRPQLVGHVPGRGHRGPLRHRRGRPARAARARGHPGPGPLRPAPRFALTLVAFQARPTTRTYHRFMRQCSFDLDGLREQMGERWEPFVAYNLELARGPGAKVVGRMLRELGLPRIPPAELARIAVPTTLIWGRQDRAIRLRIAEAASARYGWPLRVIERLRRRPPARPARGVPASAAHRDRKADRMTSFAIEETADALAERLRGALLAPGDAGFEDATRLWNGMIDKTPALVVQPTGTADVVEAVNFAREHDLALSVRGGGHNIAGTGAGRRRA